MKSSKIFGPKELEEINLRLEGKKKNYGLWYKTKLKISELLDWFAMEEKLRELIKGGKK